jgi:hypothetical protein
MVPKNGRCRVANQQIEETVSQYVAWYREDIGQEPSREELAEMYREAEMNTPIRKQ